MISALPLYSNAKDPEIGLVEQPQVFFDPPVFLRLLWQKVTREHPQILIQVQTLKSAGFDTEAAEQAFYPTPSFSIERAQSNGSSDPSYAGTPQVAIAKIQQALWTGGRITATRNKAIANQEVEWARLQEIQQGLALKTLQAWTEVLIAQRQQGVFIQTQSELTQLKRKIERRAEQGLSTQSEVRLSTLKVAMVQQMISHAKLQEDLAWLRLKQWVPEAESLNQEAAEHTFPLMEMPAHLENLDNTDWLSLSATQSPMALRLQAQLKVQEAELQEKRAAYQPDIYLRAERQHGNFAYSNSQNVNRIFIGMTASTGAGLSLQSQLASLMAKHESAQYDMALTQRQLTESVQSEWMNLSARQSKAEELKSNLESLQEIQTAWIRQFDNGRKTWIEVMNAAQETMQSQLAILDNDTAMQLSYWRLQIYAWGVSRWTQP